MLKLPLWTVLVILAALLACGAQTPTPGGAVATVPATTEAAAPSSSPPTQGAEPTETPLPVSTATPGSNAATTPLPANSPTPQGTEAPLRATSEPETLPPGDVIIPLNLNDSEAALSRLSKPEILCLEQAAGPGRLHQILRDVRVPVPEEEAWIVACLGDETLFGVLVAMLLGDPEPLSQETSACLRTGLEWVDPREFMTEGIRGREGNDRAGAIFLSGYFTAAACLNQEEWDAAAADLGLNPGDQETFQCFLEALGGPEALAAALEGTDEAGSVSLYPAMLGCGLDFEGTSEDTQTGPPPATPATSTTLTITVAPVPAGIPEYDRSDWRHWIDEDGDCQDARQEVLIAESLDQVTFETDRECRVEGGQWFGAFTGTYVEDPGDLDIDHMVPLKNAHLSGAWAWNPAVKEEYANYLGEENHLIAVTASANRSKGARGPEEWKPTNQGYWCQYATDWAEIKQWWELTMTKVESEFVMDMLGTCENPPDVDVREALESAAGEHKPEPTVELQNLVYGSCQEAEFAGESRFQGSQGGGLGYPKAMVPSARDGDGDGVVCER